jgi:hypothetical protein
VFRGEKNKKKIEENKETVLAVESTPSEFVIA